MRRRGAVRRDGGACGATPACRPVRRHGVCSLMRGRSGPCGGLVGRAAAAGLLSHGAQAMRAAAGLGEQRTGGARAAGARKGFARQPSRRLPTPRHAPARPHAALPGRPRRVPCVQSWPGSAASGPLRAQSRWRSSAGRGHGAAPRDGRRLSGGHRHAPGCCAAAPRRASAPQGRGATIASPFPASPDRGEPPPPRPPATPATTCSSPPPAPARCRPPCHPRSAPGGLDRVPGRTGPAAPPPWPPGPVIAGLRDALPRRHRPTPPAPPPRPPGCCTAPRAP
jgi:hypothetical protein